MLEAVVSGLGDGLSGGEIADSIAALGAFSEQRAELIADNEIATANSAGALDGYRQARSAGVMVKKGWGLGPNPCPICRKNAAASPIGLDESFPSGHLHPTAHPYCHCDLYPVVAHDD